MIGQMVFEYVWRERQSALLWVGAAALHAAVLGPVLFTHHEQAESAARLPIEIEIVELQAQRPTMAAMPEPDRVEQVESAPSPSPVVTVPIVRAAPRQPEAVIIRRTPLPTPVAPAIRAMPSPAPGVGMIGGAEQFALRAIFCRDMTQWQREDAGCESVERARNQYAPLYEATPLLDYARIAETHVAQLAATIGQGEAEGFLARNTGVPQTVGGALNPVDNSIFVPRRDASRAARDRIARGLKPDWEDGVRRAHGTD